MVLQSVPSNHVSNEPLSVLPLRPAFLVPSHTLDSTQAERTASAPETTITNQRSSHIPLRVLGRRFPTLNKLEWETIWKGVESTRTEEKSIDSSRIESSHSYRYKYRNHSYSNLARYRTSSPTRSNMVCSSESFFRDVLLRRVSERRKPESDFIGIGFTPTPSSEWNWIKYCELHLQVSI